MPGHQAQFNFGLIEPTPVLGGVADVQAAPDITAFLVAEMVAREGRTVRELLERLYGEVGRVVTMRDNLKLSPELEAVYADKVNAVPVQIAGARVTEVIRIDGTKLLLDDGSWMLFRKSGTEPVVRLYGEAGNDARLAEVMEAGRRFILG